MHEFDLLIRGGRVVDGSGRESVEADIAIAGSTIAAVGRLDRRARGCEEIDARGLLVTPGFVDIHTHYDGHVTWAERLVPSSTHGVTTVLFGNCGVGFAPCRPEDRARLIRLMEGVEDIPEPVLSAGLEWNWTGFPEYLDLLARRAYDIDIAAQIPHGPLRVHAMGERALAREAATDADVRAMRALATQAMNAGAFGFSTSRSINHRASDGSHTPTLHASARELVGIAEGVAESGRGVIQLISDFEDLDAEFDLVRQIAGRARLPVSFTLLQLPHAPERWRELLLRIHAANRDGLAVRGQVCGRPVGLLLGFELTFTPFSFCPSYQELAALPLAPRLARLRDAAMRQRILEEFAVPLEQRGEQIARAFASRTVDLRSTARFLTDLRGMYLLGDPPDYEPPEQKCIAAAAARAGQTPAAFAYDALLVRDGAALIYVPATNFCDGTLDAALEMMRDEFTVLGLSDAGAHCSLICDASFSTYMLCHWARDRKRGLPLESVVRALSLDTAGAVGMRDRGLLAPGYKADINIIDFERLRLHPPHVIHDLPAGGKRLSQDADGYVHTIVSGVRTYADGRATGALPGRLVRSAPGASGAAG